MITPFCKEPDDRCAVAVWIDLVVEERRIDKVPQGCGFDVEVSDVSAGAVDGEEAGAGGDVPVDWEGLGDLVGGCGG